MSGPVQRKPILTAEALNGLNHAKQEILDATVGTVPEPLVRLTVVAAGRLARRHAAREVLSERVLELVQASLLSLAQQKWKLDTALLLKRRESDHERRE